VAAVEAVLYSRLDSGHTWTSRADLEHGVRKLLLSHQLARKAPDVAVDDMGAIPFGGGYQPAGASAMEQFCARVLRQAIDEPLQYALVAPEITPAEIKSSLQAVETHQGFSLTAGQRDAVHMVLTSRVGLLGGYAGSGKTSVLRAVCDVAEAHGRVMYLMALSGKAARRITEATKRSASMIGALENEQDDRAKVNGLFGSLNDWEG
jgi:exodeoxyribonuclease V alpha subunit